LLVFRAADGAWSVNEEAPGKTAISYFASKLGAVRHAIRLAKSRRPSEVSVLDRDGSVRERRRFEPGRGKGAR
jgi:hypothetical protein